MATSRRAKPTPMEAFEDKGFVGRDWDSLRQGARNVAGVRFQLAVTALLLLESRGGTRPFVELIPEGYEDIDARDSDGISWFMQVKEVGAGAGRVNISMLTDVLAHAAHVAHPTARIVAISDGEPGQGLVESGWDRTLQDAEGVDLGRLAASLAARGHAREQADDLIGRAHLVRLPWNVSISAITSLAATYDIPRGLASLVFAALVEDLTALAADQRSTTADTAGRRRVGDLDQLVDRVLDVVDRDQLDSAVTLGVCGPADFISEPAIDVDEFLLGVDAEPAHIAAGFDVIRPVAARAVQEALDDERYSLLAGPSGAGKSTQIWRSARDRSTGARIIRVHRLVNDHELRELVRHVRLLRPTAASPVVVVCDDLGRPHTASWPLATKRLLQIPNVLLLGAVRNEDLTPELLRHGGVLVELTLDEATALSIAEQFELSGFELTLEVSEAVALADGQLMEFVSLLTSGRRLRAVLADQAHHLLTGADPSAAQIARLVCSAHVLGVSVHADRLSEVSDITATLSASLQRLQDEHIITTSGDEAWRGLHQRRSEVLTERLHATPPPTLRSTLATVVELLAPAAVGWALRRIVELYGDAAETWDLSGSAADAAARCTTAREVALLLEGLERADHALTARAYIPVLERHRRPTVPLLDLATVVLARKLAGISFGHGQSGKLSAFERSTAACAGQLADPSSALTAAAAAALGVETLTDLVTSADLEDAVRLLEVAAPNVRLKQENARRIARRFPWPDGILDPASRRLNSRLIAAMHVAVDDTDILIATFGTLGSRLQEAAAAHPDTLAARVVTNGRQVELELLAQLNADGAAVRLPWDLPTAKSGADDPINRAAVELATYVGECCPETETVEVRTVTAERKPNVIGGFEPGHKRLGKEARPDRHLVRLNVGIQVAIGRQSSAYSWSDLARRRARLAAELRRLTSECPRRLSSHDNPRRRAEWVTHLSEVDRGLAELPRPPLSPEFKQGSSGPTWSSERDEEPLVRRLRQLTAAVRMLVPDDSGVLNHLGVAGQLEMVGSLTGVLKESDALVVAGEAETYRQLDGDLQRLRRILVATVYDSSVASKVRGRPEELAATVDRLVKETASAQLAEERERIIARFESVPGATLHRMPDPKPFLTSIVGHQWVLTLPPESWGAAVAVAADAVATDGRVVDVPLCIVCQVGGSLLPVAGRLTQLFESGLLPLDPESVGLIADGLRMPVVEGAYTRLVTQVVERLARASWLNARSQHRPRDWATVEDEAHEDLEDAARLVAEAIDSHGALAAGLGFLIEQVRRELAGETAAHFVSAVSSGILKSDDVVSDELAALANAQLAALDLNLASLSPSAGD